MLRQACPSHEDVMCQQSIMSPSTRQFEATIRFIRRMVYVHRVKGVFMSYAQVFVARVSTRLMKKSLIGSLVGLLLTGLTTVAGTVHAQTTVLGSTLSAAAVTHAQYQCLFRWAEDKLPTYFRSQSPSTQNAGGYVLRHYEKSNTYLGIQSASKRLYFYAPNDAGLRDLGPVSEWVAQAGCNEPFAEVATPFDSLPVAPLCSPTDPGQNCVETHARAVRIDDEARFGFASTSFDKASGVLRAELNSGATLDPRFESGTFVYRSRKDRSPLLHRIDSVSRSGQTVNMSLTRVNAKEVFPRARIRARIPFAPTATPTAARAAISRATSQPFGVSDCSGNVFNKSFADAGSAGGNGVQGSVTFDLTSCHFILQAWVDAVLEWDIAGLNVDKVELSVGGSVDAELQTKLQLEINGAYSTQKSIWTGSPTIVPAGPIVITVTPELFAGYSITGQASLTSLQGFTWTDEITVGLGYNDYDNWYPIDERKNTFTHYGPNVTFDANTTVKPWLEFQANVEAFGVAGGTISLQGFAQAKLTGEAKYVNNKLSGTMCASLDVGLTPRAGVIVELLGADIFTRDWPLYTFQKNVVSNSCINYSGVQPSIPADADPNRSQCFFDSQCSPTNPNDATLQAKCKKGGQLSNGLYQYKCETIIPTDYCLPGSTFYKCESLSPTGKAGADVLTPSCNTVTHRCEMPLREEALQGMAQTAATGLTQAQQATVESVGTISPIAAASATCIAPGCCRENSECADGDVSTVDTCEKPLVAPSRTAALGVCKSVSRQSTLRQ